MSRIQGNAGEVWGVSGLCLEMTEILEAYSDRKFWISLSLDLVLCGCIPVSEDNICIDKLRGRNKTNTSLLLMQKGYKVIGDSISRQIEICNRSLSNISHL